MLARLHQRLPPRTRRPAVLLTGFSSALDLELARAFGQRGYDLALCSSDETRLGQALHKLRGLLADIRIEKVLIDDADSNGQKKLLEAIKELGLRVRVVLANVRAHAKDIDAACPLFTPFLAEMARRGKGRLLVSQSFDAKVLPAEGEDAHENETALEMALALWRRWEGRGMSVSALLAGAITTELDVARLADRTYGSLVHGNPRVFTSVTFGLEREPLSLPSVKAA
jgi:hypothetical protein